MVFFLVELSQGPGLERFIYIWGFQKRLFKVIVPPGMKEGSLLKLKELGKDAPHGQKGDLLLKVAIQK